MVDRSAINGSVDGISAWSMSSLRWAGGIQFLSCDVVRELFQKLTAPKFKGYVRRPERKARSHVRPPAWPRCSDRSRHQGRAARGSSRITRGRRQLSIDARVPRTCREESDGWQRAQYGLDRTAAS